MKTDVGVNRSQDDISFWRSKDPILRLSNALLDSKLITQSELDGLTLEVTIHVQHAWSQALSDPSSDPAHLLQSVYYSA